MLDYWPFLCSRLVAVIEAIQLCCLSLSYTHELLATLTNASAESEVQLEF